MYNGEQDDCDEKALLLTLVSGHDEIILMKIVHLYTPEMVMKIDYCTGLIFLPFAEMVSLKSQKSVMTIMQ